MLVSSNSQVSNKVSNKALLGITPVCKDGGEFFVLKCQNIMWVLLSLGASIFWGFLYVLKEQIYGKISIFTSIMISSLFLFLVTGTVSLFSGVLKRDITSIASSRELFWYIIAGLGILLAAELLIAFSITAKNATLAGLIEISYPIFIALFSYILYKSQVSWQTLVGGFCIFVGIFIIYYFNK